MLASIIVVLQATEGRKPETEQQPARPSTDGNVGSPTPSMRASSSLSSTPSVASWKERVVNACKQLEASQASHIQEKGGVAWFACTGSFNISLCMELLRSFTTDRERIRQCLSRITIFRPNNGDEMAADFRSIFTHSTSQRYSLIVVDDLYSFSFQDKAWRHSHESGAAIQKEIATLVNNMLTSPHPSQLIVLDTDLWNHAPDGDSSPIVERSFSSLQIAKLRQAMRQNSASPILSVLQPDPDMLALHTPSSSWLTHVGGCQCVHVETCLVPGLPSNTHSFYCSSSTSQSVLIWRRPQM
jgi:hypothetical protein